MSLDFRLFPPPSNRQGKAIVLQHSSSILRQLLFENLFVLSQSILNFLTFISLLHFSPEGFLKQVILITRHSSSRYICLGTAEPTLSMLKLLRLRKVQGCRRRFHLQARFVSTEKSLSDFSTKAAVETADGAIFWPCGPLNSRKLPFFPSHKFLKQCDACILCCNCNHFETFCNIRPIFCH